MIHSNFVDNVAGSSLILCPLDWYAYIGMVSLMGPRVRWCLFGLSAVPGSPMTHSLAFGVIFRQACPSRLTVMINEISQRKQISLVVLVYQIAEPRWNPRQRSNHGRVRDNSDICSSHNFHSSPHGYQILPQRRDDDEAVVEIAAA